MSGETNNIKIISSMMEILTGERLRLQAKGKETLHEAPNNGHKLE